MRKGPRESGYHESQEIEEDEGDRLINMFTPGGERVHVVFTVLEHDMLDNEEFQDIRDYKRMTTLQGRWNGLSKGINMRGEHPEHAESQGEQGPGLELQ